jgi:hypothetical protein
VWLLSRSCAAEIREKRNVITSFPRDKTRDDEAIVGDGPLFAANADGIGECDMAHRHL